MRRIDAGAHLWKTKDRLYQFYWVTFPTKKYGYDNNLLFIAKTNNI